MPKEPENLRVTLPQMNPSTQHPHRRGRVFIVDDDVPTLEVLRTALNHSGFETVLSDNPTEAIRMIESDLPDIVITDIRMPRTSGFEICRQIKRMKHGTEIPVIFISGTENQGDIHKALEVGGADVIRKPFVIDELLLRVRHQLELKHSRDRLNQIYADQQDFFVLLTHDLRERLQRPNHLNESLRLEMTGLSDARINSILVGIEAEFTRLRRHLDDLVTWGRFQLGDQPITTTVALAYVEIEEILTQLRPRSAVRRQTLVNKCDSRAEVHAKAGIFQNGMRMLIATAGRVASPGSEIVISCQESEQGCAFNISGFASEPYKRSPESLLSMEMILESGISPEFGMILGSRLIERHGGTVKIINAGNGLFRLTVFVPSQDEAI